MIGRWLLVLGLLLPSAAAAEAAAAGACSPLRWLQAHGYRQRREQQPDHGSSNIRQQQRRRHRERQRRPCRPGQPLGAFDGGQDWSSDVALYDDMEIEEEDADGDADAGPHPLRTAEWRLSTRPLFGLRRHDEYMTFHRNGTVESPGRESGRWWFDVGGLHWELHGHVDGASVVTHHRAELHWNIFGTQPRMYRGTVTRDRSPASFLPPWLLRPVVSTFYGFGVGDDSADLSYKHRSRGADVDAEVPRDRRFDTH